MKVDRETIFGVEQQASYSKHCWKFKDEVKMMRKSWMVGRFGDHDDDRRAEGAEEVE